MDVRNPKSCYVILHIATGPSRVEIDSAPTLIVTGTERFTLNQDIWIERLGEEIAKNIQRACEPPHYRIDKVDRDRHLYAFVRQMSTRSPSENCFLKSAAVTEKRVVKTARQRSYHEARNNARRRASREQPSPLCVAFLALLYP